MTKIAEIMTTDLAVVQPQDSLRDAATLMQDLDIGALPVCDGRRLLGMLTDRDITVRGVAAGMKPDEACVSDVMSPDLQFCHANEDTEAVLRQMGDQKLRRLPVVDAEKNLVGIVALGDLAVRQRASVDQAVRAISQPGGARS